MPWLERNVQEAAPAVEPLPRLIRADQLAAVRRSVLISIPVNVALGATAALVAWRSGHAGAGLIWFAASSVVNALRIVLCRLPERSDGDARLLRLPDVDQRLRFHWILALCSGLVWACIPTLSDGFTSPQTLFYLTIVCGITAGAVTHGFAYARIPICFITPPLLSTVACLVAAGGFDRNCLAATVVLYLAALIRSCRESEQQVRESSRLKNEATSLAHSLEVARDQATTVAGEMRRRASHDGLTGLLNRSGFLEEAERRTALARTPLCLMLLDLDGFKAVNDTYGHKAGDNVLIEVARRLQMTLPSDVALARLGGDEFAVLYEPEAGGNPPAIVAQQLIAAVSIPFAAFDSGRIGVSIGVHVSETPSIDAMLSAADAALYAAKLSGRNRFYLFDDDLSARLDMRRDVERDLARALAHREVEVWFQPVMADRGSRFGGFEALVRWRHRKHGWIAPHELVATASLAGLAEPLMRFILGEVCAMIRALRSAGHANVRVAMNVSPREMSQIAVDELVLRELRRQGAPPAMLEIEITEETALDIQAVQGKLTALAEAGVRIAIDDFGVGYSSLGALRRLRVDRVKIDRCFVDGIAASSENRMLVQAILRLGEAFGFEVVAEGIERAEDFATLKALGCPAMQGYYFGHPAPAEEAFLRLESGEAARRRLKNER
ncbi:putative bifunctional diguanylate cyclase/phosphodiesterase [Methylopila henanensis]|uniref:Bifunctional diguanylate cyclase/phosphodiesterase n=1 Tax=Methylopila henanensis TaxID=873516 RepID=A0ABW4KFP6_9HYPH